MTRVVVAGSFNVDHVWRCESLPRPGETLAGTYSIGPGGKGFNQAVAAARAGASTTFLCALGDDAGAALARSLASADDIDLIEQRSTLPTGTAGIYVDADGHNAIVIGAGANGDLDAACLVARSEVFEGARVVLVQCESPMEAILTTLALGRKAGATTLFNPAPAHAQIDAKAFSLTDILTPNESEFAALATRLLDDVRVDADDVAAMDDAALHRLCRRLLPVGTVVITLGSAGAFVSHFERQLRGDPACTLRIPAFPATPIDTTGAGDAFSGALAASLAQRETAFAEHVRFAARYAARATESAGAAIAMPRLLPADL